MTELVWSMYQHFMDWSVGIFKSSDNDLCICSNEILFARRRLNLFNGHMWLAPYFAHCCERDPVTQRKIPARVVVKPTIKAVYWYEVDVLFKTIKQVHTPTKRVPGEEVPKHFQS